MTPSGMRGVLNDALSIYFLDATLASPFVARWFAGYKVETAEGVLVQQDTARAPQTPDRPALGIGEAVIGTLPCVIQLLASRQRQPAIRLWIDILRVHRFPSI